MHPNDSSYALDNPLNHLGRNNPAGTPFAIYRLTALSQSFHSPTDHMVSPCTKKLAQSKQRHFNK